MSTGEVVHRALRQPNDGNVDSVSIIRSPTRELIWQIDVEYFVNCFVPRRQRNDVTAKSGRIEYGLKLM